MARIGVRVEATEEATDKQFGGFPDLPNGVYQLEMEAGVVDEQGDEGTPQHKVTVKLTARVLAPEEYKDRKLFCNYAIVHPSAKKQEIDYRNFQCLLRALELTEVPDDDSDNLLFISFTATIGMGKDSDEKNEDGTPKWPARNEIKRYWFPDQNNTPALGITGPAPAARQSPANDNRQAAKPAAAAAPAARRPWGK